MADTCAASFVDWFTSHPSARLSNSCGIISYSESEMGRGLIALQDINEGDVLFSIPRDLVLSTATSSLPSLLGQDFTALPGWTGLILCMAWEYLTQGKWKAYFDVMPHEFTTPIFWSEEDLRELQGSLILEKIGKAEAEESFAALFALVQARKDVFANPERYTTELFHQMGSLILSRSFTVEPPEEKGDVSMENQLADQHAADGVEANDLLAGTSDQLSPEKENQEQEEEELHQTAEDEEEIEDASTVAMVPFADILNAKSGSANAHLVYQLECLDMTATKDIKQGDQIFNTYADPPNSDLLRRYGHVDIPNEHDVVEIPGDLIMDTVCAAVEGVAELKEPKVEWSLEMGMDDCISLSREDLLPDDLLSYIVLFASSKTDLEKLQLRDTIPQPQKDEMTLKLIKRVLKARLGQYPTTLEEDEKLLQAPRNGNHRNAIIVRKGEKELLHLALAEIAALEGERRKRKRPAEGKSGSKKVKK